MRDGISKLATVTALVGTKKADISFWAEMLALFDLGESARQNCTSDSLQPVGGDSDGSEAASHLQLDKHAEHKVWTGRLQLLSAFSETSDADDVPDPKHFGTNP